MATVTITEILGGDNIAASRIVLNNNFSLLQNAINTIETRLNTSYVPGGSLNVGDVQVLKYNRAVTQNIFLLQASGQIDGNLSLGTPTNNSTLGVTGFLTVSQALTVNGQVGFTNTPGNLTFTNQLRNIEDDSYAHTQWYAGTTKSPVVNIQAVLGVLTVTQSTRVMHLDASAVIAPNNILVLPVPTTLNQGQIFTLVFDTVSPTNLVYEIDNSTGWDPAFSNATLGANIILNNTFNSLTDARFKGIWIDIAVGINGYKVIGSHTDVLYI